MDASGFFWRKTGLSPALLLTQLIWETSWHERVKVKGMPKAPN